MCGSFSNLRCKRREIAGTVQMPFVEEAAHIEKYEEFHNVMLLMKLPSQFSHS